MVKRVGINKKIENGEIRVRIKIENIKKKKRNKLNKN